MAETTSGFVIKSTDGEIQLTQNIKTEIVENDCPASLNDLPPTSQLQANEQEDRLNLIKEKSVIETDSEKLFFDNSSSSDWSLSEDSDDDDPATITDGRMWCRMDSTARSPPRFPFTGTPGMTIHLPDKENPLSYFQLFFCDKVVQYITNETNRFAEQFITSNELKQYLYVRHWLPTNSSEIMVFLAILILHSIVQKPKQGWFWSKMPLIETPYFARIMPEKRFQLIMKFLHFADNKALETSNHPHQKLKKIYHVYKMINDKFQSVYIPQRDISIDGSLLLYKGQLGWAQYLPKKRSSFGIKSFILCESESGYIWNSVIYTGKDTPFDKDYEEFGPETKTVMSLIKPLLNKGYCLTIDNFYNSPQLADMLILQNTDVYGTLSLNRREIPLELKHQKLKKGEFLAYQREKIMILKWMDKKPVTLLSSIHNSEFQTVQIGSKEVSRPKIFHDYNFTMGVVRKSDQCMSYYQSARKQQKKILQKNI